MSMDLSLRFYLAVNESECRDSKIKIFAVPVRLSQRELLTESSFIDLDYIDAVCFKIKNLISYSKSDLEDALLDGNVFSRE